MRCHCYFLCILRAGFGYRGGNGHPVPDRNEQEDEFLQKLRAAVLPKLDNAELPISEIACEVGFSDPDYFSKTFHDAYG